MIIPEIKTLNGIDLDRPNLPAEPDDCEVAIDITIGPVDSVASDIFAFSIITPTALARENRFRWGRGLLIVPTFSWEIVDLALDRLLAHCTRPSWKEVARELNQNLLWEFDNYQNYQHD
jgi:hypothetical protein